MSIKMSDLYWLAGLLEGEGCFIFIRNYPAIQLKMCDHDVVERAHKLMRSPSIYTFQPKEKGWNRVYFIRIVSVKAIGWMMTLYPLMGIRRKEAIKSAILKWKAVYAHFGQNGKCKNGHDITKQITTKRRCLTCHRNNGRERRRRLLQQRAVQL